MKRHQALSLLALTLVGASALWAATTPELATTDVFDGQRIYLSAQWIEATSEENPDGLLGTPYYLGVLTPNSTQDSLVFAQFADGTPGDSYTFTLEAAGTKVKGIDAYYIRNDFSGKYLHKNTTENEGCADLWLSDKSQATAWAVFTAADHADLTGYSGRDIPAEAMQIMALSTDDTPYYITYNGVFSMIYKQMYPDYFWYVDQTMAMTTVSAQTWFMMETVASQEDAFEELRTAIATGKAISRPGGTDPGFYDPELVQQLNTLLTEATELMDELGATDQQAKDMAARLTTASEALMSCKPNPMTDGYYYLVNGAYDLRATEADGIRLAIRDGGQGAPSWHRLDAADPAYVWHLTRRADGRYDAQNLLTGLYLDAAQNATTVTMAETSTVGVDVSLIATGATFAIALYDSSTKNYTPLYANNYTQTALYDGAGSTLMLRSGGANTAGSWYMSTVPADQLEQLLEDAPVAQLRKDLTALIARGAALYAAAVEYEPGENLITDLSQLESNAAMGPESEWGEDGGGLAALIDNDESTFFHTAWTDNIPTETVTDAEGNEISVAQKHWLTITLPEAVDKVSFVFTRRTPANDNSPSDFDLLGSNDEVNWTTILEGYNNFDPTLAVTTVIPDLELGAKYRMLRLVVNHTDGSRGTDRKSEEGDAIYWNLAELKVCTEVHFAPGCQAASMPEEAVKGLADALGKAKKALDKPTQADIDALQQAIDAFKAVYVDATPLLALAAEAEQVSQSFETGTGLGFYAEGTANPLPELITQAIEMVELTAYTAATITEQMNKLNEALATIRQAMQQTPDPTKYYTLHFPEMADFEAHGWSTTDGMNDELGYYLFGRQATVGTSAEQQTDATDVRNGATMYFVDTENIADEELAQFRFIPQTDGTYLMQNRATGLYIHGNSNSYAALTLSQAPSAVRITGLGCGKLQIDVIAPDGTPQGNLYAQLYGTQLSLSTLKGLGSNGALELHEVEGETVNESDIEMAPIELQMATYYTMCYPLSVSCEEGQMYTVAGLVTKDNTTYVGLKAVNHAEAGEPFVYVLNIDGVEYTAQPTADDSTAVQFTFGQELAAQPQEVNGLKGTFSAGMASEGETVLTMDATTKQPKWLTVQKKSTYNERSVRAYSALITDVSQLPAIAEADADLLIALDNAGADAIASLAGTTPSHQIFDLSGRKVSTPTQRGIYISNGKKYVVR